MASIVHRNNRYCVVYSYSDEKGSHKQRWETFQTKADAKKRKKEIEYMGLGKLIVPQCHTVNELLKEYIELYGKNTWALSTYEGNVGLIRHYISPIIGDMKLSDLNTHVIEQYYQRLLRVKPVGPHSNSQKEEFLTPATVHQVHKVLRNCMTQAVKWELIERNPCTYATLPKVTPQERNIWDAETLFHAIEVCDDPKLKLCMNLAFSCSLRFGELLGLTWDCVEISPEAIESGNAFIYINKELQRVNRKVMNTLENKDVITIFPSANSRTATLLVLKTPKTKSSIRKIFLPRSVAEMLVEWKKEQDSVKEALGAEYINYNLVIASPLGSPTERKVIASAFRKLIQDNDLPQVVFHSLRHSSITYKLKLNGGDVKAVQGDSGHAQANMVTEVYSHILDNDRKRNAQLFEKEFYSREAPKEEKPAEEPSPAADTEGTNAQMLEKLLGNPELTSLLKALAKSL